jgi:hypothetical protein
MQARMLQTMQ